MGNLKEFLRFMVSSMVDEPDKIEIEETVSDGRTVLRLRVAQADMGKIIGRQGKTAKAMRGLLSAAAAKWKIWYTLEIVD